MGRLAYVLRAMECEARAAARLYGWREVLGWSGKRV